MTILTREQIVEAARAGVKPREFAVPEWGGSVLVCAMPLGERMDYQRQARAALNDGTREPEEIALDLVLRAIVDASGARVFAPEDAPLVKSFGHDGVMRVWHEARRLNGFMEADEVKDVAGN